MGLNVKLVFKPSLNVVYCSTAAIVVNVVQHCSGQIWPKLGFWAEILPAPPIGGAQEGIEKETVHIGFCRVLTRQSHIVIVDIDSIRPNLGLIWPTLVEYVTKSRSFRGQNGPNLGTSG